jgi:hypothetical protein
MEELTMPQKKKVRELIDRALERELKSFYGLSGIW